ncbi:MAG: YjcQ family protein [Oscillospiraceae bacterium]|nr:YjcQ family protein [Oscillospiraceae bacterium]
MAKDDYDVLVYKIIVYLYACMKRKIIFDEAVFFKTVGRGEVSEDYFTDVLRLMQDEKLIEGGCDNQSMGQHLYPGLRFARHEHHGQWNPLSGGKWENESCPANAGRYS